MGLLRDLVALPWRSWVTVVAALPGPAGDRLRTRHWRKRLGHLGRNVRISEGAFFQNPGHIRIEDGAWIDRNVLILAGPPAPGRPTLVKPNDPFPIRPGEVHIGAGTHIAPNCVLSGIGGLWIGRACGVASNSTLYSYSHHYRNLTDPADQAQYSFTPRARRDQQAMISSPVFIGDHCAVGLNATLLPGTRLERGTWVASGTVVKGRWGPQVTVKAGPDGLAAAPMQDLAIRE